MQSKQRIMFLHLVYINLIMIKLPCSLNRTCLFIKWKGNLKLSWCIFRTTFYEDLIKKTKNRAPPVGTYNHKGMNPKDLHGIFKRYAIKISSILVLLKNQMQQLTMPFIIQCMCQPIINQWSLRLTKRDAVQLQSFGPRVRKKKSRL